MHAVSSISLSHLGVAVRSCVRSSRHYLHYLHSLASSPIVVCPSSFRIIADISIRV